MLSFSICEHQFNKTLTLCFPSLLQQLKNIGIYFIVPDNEMVQKLNPIVINNELNA